MKRFIQTQTYFILAVLLMIFETLLILKGHWVDDFWQHSAVVQELSRNLLHPSNPVIQSKIPHAFFSPYSILVALFAKVTGLSSISALEWFAFFNLIFLLLSFHWFCKKAFPRNHNTIASISLVLIGVFWGARPEFWSGFFHIAVLNFVLPYPSTFSMALTFTVWAILIKNQNSLRLATMLPATVMGAVIFIIHPTTAILFFAGMAGIVLGLHQASLTTRLLKLLGMTGGSIALAMLWPYYNVAGLLAGTSNEFHQDSLGLYYGFVWKYWPLALALPGLIFVRKDRIVRLLWLTLFLLLAIYFAGYFLRIYGTASVISGAMMFAHLIIAYTLIRMINTRHSHRKLYFLALGASLIFSIAPKARLLGGTVLRVFTPKNTSYYTRYQFLRDAVDPNEVIMADHQSNLYIPSFQGKVISTTAPLHWVNDIAARRAAVSNFFNPEIPDPMRGAILATYRPPFVLIDHKAIALPGHSLQWLRLRGKTVYENDGLELIRLSY